MSDSKNNLYQNALDYFEWNKNETAIFLPNEIFNDLNFLTVFDNQKINFRHKSFAYAFYYLSNYLYRHCKYSSIEPLSKLYMVNLIEWLQCSRKQYSFIVKKEGLLDSIGYTISQNDFPIEYILQYDELVDFRMYSSLEPHIKKVMQIPPNFAIKKPIKAFKREKESINLDGTFFQVENTHHIPFQVFSMCLKVDKQGIELFYIYGFLKAFEGLLKQKEVVHKSYIFKTLGTNNKKFQYCLRKLEEFKLIKVTNHHHFMYEMINME